MDVSKALRTIQANKRYVYNPEEVNFIREAFLLDRKSLAWLMANVRPAVSENAFYKIATGKAYPGVPLSPRLVAAYAESEAKAQRAGQSSTGPVTESGAADPVRADELLDESEPDWG